MVNLSPRELDVLRYISSGMSSQEAADSLNISKRTVDKHLQHIFTKLGVHNRVAAAAIYRRHTSISDHKQQLP